MDYRGEIETTKTRKKKKKGKNMQQRTSRKMDKGTEGF